MTALTAVKQKTEQINATVTKRIFGKHNRKVRKIKNKNLTYLNDIVPPFIAFLGIIANAVLVGITVVVGICIGCCIAISGFFQSINRGFEGGSYLAGKFYRLRKIK